MLFLSEHREPKDSSLAPVRPAPAFVRLPGSQPRPGGKRNRSDVCRPSPPDYPARPESRGALPGEPREPGRDASALDCPFSFVLSNLQLSTFNFQPCSKSFPYLVTSLRPCFLFLKSFICNTYVPPRKCCKQKTYAQANPFRCNTYKKHGRGGPPFSQTTSKPSLQVILS